MHRVPHQNAYQLWNESSPVIYSVFARIRIEQELNELLQNPIASISCGPIKVNDLLHWYVYFIGPKHTPYQNGKYYLLMDFPNSYPMRGPWVRYDTKQCKCYHKNVDGSGNIISMLNDQKWWNAKMGIKDLLIKIRNMLFNDDLNRILDIPQISMRRNYINNNLRKYLKKNMFLRKNNRCNDGSSLIEHIITACLYNFQYCNGSPVPHWLISLKYNCNNNNNNNNYDKQMISNILHITKHTHESNLQKIKSIFYENSKLCSNIIDIVIQYYGNQWEYGRFWLTFENYNPLIKYIKDNCKHIELTYCSREL